MLLILRLQTKYIAVYIHWIFRSQIPAKYFTKFRLFHQEQHEISFFSPLWLHLQEVHNQSPISVDWKGGQFNFNYRWECSVNKTLPFFANFIRWL